MQLNDHPEPSHRETLLTVILTGLGAGGFLLFLIMISGGFFFWVLVAVAVMVGLGFFHYILWGYAMTQEVAEEQAQEAQRQLDALDQPINDRVQRKM
jgi:fatty acid desaturase